MDSQRRETRGKMFTKQQIDEYVKTKGLACPYCNSVGHSTVNGRLIFDAEHYEVNQPMICRMCKREWYDVYKLSAIAEIEAPVAPPAVTGGSCDCENQSPD